MGKKGRLDVVLHERGFFPSREKAKAAVMAGVVSVGGVRALKAGTPTAMDAEISVSAPACPYVGRGGLKLEAALDGFSLSVEGLVAIDIGASTGGFTDCLLKRGARRVYAIDVGYGQLDWKLRNDPRVVNIERTNIRLLEPSSIPEKAGLVTIDVSFISLRLVLPVAERLMDAGGRMVCLVKPQFEAGRGQVGKGGVVRDPDVHREALRMARLYADENGLSPAGAMPSPIKGAKGNTEFLLLLERPPLRGLGNGVSEGHGPEF
ncbi:MAG: TlyA family RNA methyltransferase [Clostridiales Family XIII bacterium]|jgi:23S rRNA (cytidine1920-2'-O)/16S rRNA (cytidine1409-2'-O)-methyltransferase|nr:TlyA family RNA methyltransferase [Clostridiales Family XIII bacterium]